MIATRALAWITLALGIGFAAGPAAAQYYGPPTDHYGRPQHGTPRYNGPDYGGTQYTNPGARGYQVPPPPVSRARPVDPYYGNVPSARKYGHGPNRHWRRWTRNKHPGWVPPQQYGWGRDDGWARPRYYDYR